jgi:hypothetical protein
MALSLEGDGLYHYYAAERKSLMPRVPDRLKNKVAPKRVQTAVRLPEGLHSWVQGYCVESDISFNHLVTHLLRELRSSQQNAVKVVEV